MGSSARRGTFHSLILITIGLIGLAVIAIGVTLSALRDDVLKEAAADTANIAAVLAEQAARSVQQVDLVATDIEEKLSSLAPIDEDQYLQTLRSQETWNLLVERWGRLPQADIVSVIDKFGKPANAANRWPAPDVDLSDRDYFRYHKTNPSSDLYVSSILMNRVSGGHTVFMSKRLHGPDGDFLGVVLIGLKLAHFQQIYDSITTFRQQSFMFLRKDGTVLVRYPDVAGVPGRTMPANSPWHALVETGGEFRSPGYFDGTARLVAVRPVRGYPLVVNVAISEYDALANWRHKAMLIGIGTALAVMCSLLLLYALSWQYRRLLRSEESVAERSAALAQKTAELKEVNGRIDTALNNMLQGLAMFDREMRLVVCNRRYLEMYGISSEIVTVGRPLRDILEHRKETGTFQDNIDAYLDRVRAMIATGEPMVTFTELPDGRAFRLTNKPTGDGGWVAVHEDVTEELQAERELQQTRNFLNTIIESVPDPLVVKDARTLRYVLVNRAAEPYFRIPREDMIGKTVYDALLPELAVVVDRRDRLAVESRGLVVAANSQMTPKMGERFISSKRLTIAGANGDPEFLLTILEDVTERKRNEEKIVHLAHHDPLTNLPNRAAFNARLAESIEQARGTGETFALLCTDLDRFKEVNDLFGHAAGDTVLLEIARRLRKVAGDAFLSRLGGDEFPLIVRGPQPDTARKTAEQLIAAMSQDIDYEGRKFHPGISVGVAIFPDDGADAATLLRHADAALYRAKSEGRGVVRFYEADMDRLLRDRRALQSDLSAAINRDELALYYQPQSRVTGQIVGFEALLRWDHPARGFVPPDSFIPLAEENGAIIPIGEWVLREACREAASWSKPLQIAVNLSPVQFRSDDVVRVVHSVLLETGLAPERLVLEITEGALMDDYSRAVSILRRLKALGVQIAMDDFGTGYSSLSYLQSFPFDKIKIDQTFISNLERNAQSAAIVRAVLGLAQRLNLLVVAEGVENQDQLAILRHERCDEMQGYLIGRPAPIAEYADLVGHVAMRRTAAN
jgi:diguanylate cyclase (GGDEF)-like protein/PAS domain S-box-containing protein